MVKPTKKLIIDMCTSNGTYQGFIESLHHGLYELPSLRKIYPFLDLDELVAFAASSWKERERGDNNFLDFNTLHDIFLSVNRIGISWLDKNRYISNNLQGRYRSLNPYGRKSLNDRLRNVDEDTIIKFRSELAGRVNEYVFECQYAEAKRRRGGDNSGIVIMSFQNVYPRRGKIIPAYASKCASMISGFSGDKADSHGESKGKTDSVETSQLILF